MTRSFFSKNDFPEEIGDCSGRLMHKSPDGAGLSDSLEVAVSSPAERPHYIYRIEAPLP